MSYTRNRITLAAVVIALAACTAIPDGAVARLAGLSPIVETVERIASRSEGLACNAAIEASRAGDPAFEAIAEEVRALAGSTSAVSTRVAEIVTDSIVGIEQAVRQGF